MLACLSGLAAVCSLSSQSLPPAGTSAQMRGIPYKQKLEITLWPQKEMLCAYLYIEPFMLTTVIMYERARSHAELL